MSPRWLLGFALCIGLPFVGVTASTAAPPAAPAPALAPPSPPPQPTTSLPATADRQLDALLARFSKSPGIRARFREEKHLAMLQAPLVNEGDIHYASPGKLARRTTRPLASTILIEGGRLQFGDADGHQTMNLGTNPVARLFVDSFMLLLAGDRVGLEKYFVMRFIPSASFSPVRESLARSGIGGEGGTKAKARPPARAPASRWELSLLPRVAPMNQVLKVILLRGVGLALDEMEVRETNGDWTLTVFSDVDVNHRYSPAEAAEVFRVPAR